MRRVFLWLIGLSLYMTAGTVSAHSLPPCSETDISAAREVFQQDLEAHAGKAFGTVTVSPGQLSVFGFSVTVVIDEAGRVACLSARDDVPFRAAQFQTTPERDAFLAGLWAQPFLPFTEEGRPVRTFGDIWVDEEERPPYHVIPPNGDISAAEIEIERHDHHNEPFVLSVRGDGTVTYRPERGHYIGDIVGPQSYRISPTQIAEMIDHAARAGFWSWQDMYWPEYPGDFQQETDGHTAFYDRVSIRFGGRAKTIRAYRNGGAPFAFNALFDTFSDRTKADIWGTIDGALLGQLAENGFDFTSEKAGRLLVRATSIRHVPQGIVDALIIRGAPQTIVLEGGFFDTSLLDAAIYGRRAGLRDRLLADGALLRRGKPEQNLATRALMIAIETISPESVAHILPYKPKLHIRPKPGYHGSEEVKAIPLITLAAHGFWRDPDIALSDQISVVQQLIDAGADINSRDEDGRSLLDKVIAERDDPFAEWLVAHGAIRTD